MTFSVLFWMFFVFSALQPLVRRRSLDSTRQRLVARIGKRRGSRVILLVHRQETMSLLGFLVMRYIDIEDAEAVMRACELTDPEVSLDIVLHTPGGLVLASLQIARAVREHKGKVTVFVPHYAMSDGTRIALAADEIAMSPHAVLGLVDPQLGQYPAASLLKVVRAKPMADIADQTLILAEVADNAIGQVCGAVMELLMRSQAPEQARRLAELLSTGTWTHDFPVTVEKARELGLPVRTDIPIEALELVELYPQPVRRAPSVEYLPGPRRAERGAGPNSP